MFFFCLFCFGVFFGWLHSSPNHHTFTFEHVWNVSRFKWIGYVFYVPVSQHCLWKSILCSDCLCSTTQWTYFYVLLWQNRNACLFEREMREMRETETKRVCLFFFETVRSSKNGPIPTFLWVAIIDSTIMTPMKHSVWHISGFPQQFYFQFYVKWRSYWKYLSLDQSQGLMLEIESDIMRYSV